jgi:hypothetical protein
MNFIHAVSGHASEVIDAPNLAKHSFGEQELRAYTVQLEGLKKLKQKHANLFDSSTQKLLDIYIKDTQAKIDYFKNNSY